MRTLSKGERRDGASTAAPPELDRARYLTLQLADGDCFQP